MNFLTNSSSLFSTAKHAMIDDSVFSLLEDISMWHKVTFHLNWLIVAEVDLESLVILYRHQMAKNLHLTRSIKHEKGINVGNSIKQEQSRRRRRSHKYYKITGTIFNDQVKNRLCYQQQQKINSQQLVKHAVGIINCVKKNVSLTKRDGIGWKWSWLYGWWWLWYTQFQWWLQL